MNKNKFGLTQEDMLIIKKAFSSFLEKNQKIKIWIFGSRCTNKFKKYSDIDLLIEANPQLNIKQKFNIEGVLEDSNLPYTVDLVLIENIYKPYEETILKEKIFFIDV